MNLTVHLGSDLKIVKLPKSTEKWYYIFKKLFWETETMNFRQQIILTLCPYRDIYGYSYFVPFLPLEKNQWDNFPELRKAAGVAARIVGLGLTDWLTDLPNFSR